MKKPKIIYYKEGKKYSFSYPLLKLREKFREQWIIPSRVSVLEMDDLDLSFLGHVVLNSCTQLILRHCKFYGCITGGSVLFAPKEAMGCNFEQNQNVCILFDEESKVDKQNAFFFQDVKNLKVIGDASGKMFGTYSKEKEYPVENAWFSNVRGASFYRFAAQRISIKDCFFKSFSLRQCEELRVSNSELCWNEERFSTDTSFSDINKVAFQNVIVREKNGSVQNVTFSHEISTQRTRKK